MKSSMPIAWHENCLNSRKRSIDARKKELEAAVSRLEADCLEVIEYENQINLAKKEGKTSFDQDKFAKKRRNGGQQ